MYHNSGPLSSAKAVLDGQTKKWYDNHDTSGKENKMSHIRKHFIFKGYVQGVGFRWRAYHAARRYGITGWVRNLGDGSVEMEAEGTEQDLDALLEILSRNSWIDIQEMDVVRVPLQNDRSFEIR